jgi:hypothetical protein
MAQRRLISKRLDLAERQCYFTLAQVQSIWTMLGDEGHKAVSQNVRDASVQERILTQWEKEGFRRMLEILGISDD